MALLFAPEPPLDEWFAELDAWSKKSPGYFIGRPVILDVSALPLDKPVRSGQSVVFPDGDLTILGSVASGSEVVAGGSIHIYGALRGRAIAGSTGNSTARIFCNKLEAELIAIDGLYRTAEDMDPQYRSRPVPAGLEGE